MPLTAIVPAMALWPRILLTKTRIRNQRVVGSIPTAGSIQSVVKRQQSRPSQVQGAYRVHPAHSLLGYTTFYGGRRKAWRLNPPPNGRSEEVAAVYESRRVSVDARVAALHQALEFGIDRRMEIDSSPELNLVALAMLPRLVELILREVEPYFCALAALDFDPPTDSNRTI